MPSARLFERLVRDAQGAGDLAAFRSKILETLACEIGADSGTLVDPAGLRLTPSRARQRLGLFSVGTSWTNLFLASRARYERSAERLVRAMKSGRPVIDLDVYERRERERLDLYAEVLLPQGSRSLLCAIVRHRGQGLCQLTLKRHGRGAAFRHRDADRVDVAMGFCQV